MTTNMLLPAKFLSESWMNEFTFPTGTRTFHFVTASTTTSNQLYPEDGSLGVSLAARLHLVSKLRMYGFGLGTGMQSPTGIYP
jgi:hypothetical protein